MKRKKENTSLDKIPNDLSGNIEERQDYILLHFAPFLLLKILVENRQTANDRWRK
jgi:hypothetical protein